MTKGENKKPASTFMVVLLSVVLSVSISNTLYMHDKAKDKFNRMVSEARSAVIGMDLDKREIYRICGSSLKSKISEDGQSRLDDRQLNLRKNTEKLRDIYELLTSTGKMDKSTSRNLESFAKKHESLYRAEYGLCPESVYSEPIVMDKEFPGLGEDATAALSNLMMGDRWWSP